MAEVQTIRLVAGIIVEISDEAAGARGFIKNVLNCRPSAHPVDSFGCMRAFQIIAWPAWTDTNLESRPLL
jgi:hypothetical protein